LKGEGFRLLPGISVLGIILRKIPMQFLLRLLLVFPEIEPLALARFFVIGHIGAPRSPAVIPPDVWHFQSPLQIECY